MFMKFELSEKQKLNEQIVYQNEHCHLKIFKIFADWYRYIKIFIAILIKTIKFERFTKQKKKWWKLS